jgi:shikimate kinase
MARVLLTGMSGAGKTTLLDAVARRGYPTVDTDQVLFYPRFHHVVLLTAPVGVLIERVRNRTTNPYGSHPREQAEIRRYVREVEPLLRRGATAEWDGRRPVEELADELTVLLSSP